MFKVVNSKEKRLLSDIERDFEGCVMIIKISKDCEDQGYLLAYSTSFDTNGKLNDYIASLPRDMDTCISGMYEGGDVLYVPH